MTRDAKLKIDWQEIQNSADDEGCSMVETVGLNPGSPVAQSEEHDADTGVAANSMPAEQSNTQGPVISSPPNQPGTNWLGWGALVGAFIIGMLEAAGNRVGTWAYDQAWKLVERLFL